MPMPNGDPIPNEHKNPGFVPRTTGNSKVTGQQIQPPTAQATNAVRSAIQASVPLQTMPDPNNPPIHTKAHPDPEDMWNLIKPGEVIADDLSAQEAAAHTRERSS